MCKYQQKLPVPVAMQWKNKTLMNTIKLLVAQFGIKNMGTRQPSSWLQTADDEYYAYVNGDLWDEGADLLKFWEVSPFVCKHALHLYIHHNYRVNRRAI